VGVSDDVWWRGIAGAAAAAIGLLGAAAPASARVVDAFEVGALELIALDADATVQQGPFPPDQVLFGRRHVLLSPATGSNATASAFLTQFDDEMAVSAGDAADLTLTYAPLAPVAVDWTDGGAADRLRIVVSDTTDPLTLIGSITSGAPAVEVRDFEIEAAAPGTYEVAFSTLGFGDPQALASVVAFSLSVLPQVAAPGGSFYALSDLRTVPEPDSTGLAAITALAFAARAARTRRCRSS
jgi:hypothetical protein